MPDAAAFLSRLGGRITTALFRLSILLGLVLLVLIVLILNLWNVAENQKATIANQTAIAAASNTRAVASRAIIKESLETIDKVSSNLDKLTALYLAQGEELDRHKDALAEIIAAERTLVTEQAAVLKAAKEASAAAANAASQTRSTNRTISEKVATTQEKTDVTKQTAKNVAKTKELKVLEKSIKKGQH